MTTDSSPPIAAQEAGRPSVRRGSFALAPVVAGLVYLVAAFSSFAEESAPTSPAEGDGGVTPDAGVIPEEGDVEDQEEEEEEDAFDEAVELIKRNFAGSAQLDYLAIPTRSAARAITFDGFTTELSLKLAVDVNEHISVGVKTCFGCHGFELGVAAVDIRVVEEINFRVGRFTPAFGDFPERHDPANHRTSDKPLVYDMGRMVRLREWGMSVLPAPYVDNGIAIYGTFGGSGSVFFDYAIYGIGGLRAGSGAVDVDFLQSRSDAFYYVDNNSRPSVGGRTALGFYLGDTGTLRFGASGLWGTYDPENELEYLIVGADVLLGVGPWNLRAEYLIRRTEMALGDDPEGSFRYGPGTDGEYDPFFLKDGFYVETDFPTVRWLEVVGRFDGLRRQGNVAEGSELRSLSMVLRYTLGVNFVLPRSFRIKLSGEFYDFSDFEDEVGIHLGVVGAF